jgi:flavin reductase (DIM6/NTAB) family NADH-FMN oxidoreductase RutF
VVVPRPIAWVSTTSADGVDNLAPHSFFTVACVDPPVVQFTSVGRKDSLANAEATGEFTVSLVPEWLFEEANATATDFPRERGEFTEVGLDKEPSTRVRPPRVAQSPVALECTLHSTVRLGNSTVVFGRVVHAAVADAVLVDGHPEIGLLKPLARLGRDEWATIGRVLEKPRIRLADWPQGYEPADS